MKIELNGIGIDYRDVGQGLPVVFIHAFPLNQAMWEDQARALADRFRVITLDLRGFGGSQAPEGPYSMDQMASDVYELCRALGIDRAVLVGLSMGGYVSMAFARNYPESIRALVLANTRASADSDQARLRRARSAEKALNQGTAAAVADLLPLLLASSTLQSRPDIVQKVRAMAESVQPRVFAAVQAGLAERPDSTQLLSKVNFPVLIISSDQDALNTIQEAQALQEIIPDSRLRIIQGAGHLSNLERPDQFNAILTEFLESLK